VHSIGVLAKPNKWRAVAAQTVDFLLRTKCHLLQSNIPSITIFVILQQISQTMHGTAYIVSRTARPNGAEKYGAEKKMRGTYADAQYTPPTPTRRNSTVASRRRCVLGLTERSQVK